MSSTTSDLGQAVRPDGTLKDASEIVWSYDPRWSPVHTGLLVFLAHRNVPAMQPKRTAEATTSSSLASAGLTARVPCPLQRARDAAEATAEATTSSSLASAGPGAKHKALTAAVPNRRVMRKVDLDDDQVECDCFYTFVVHLADDSARLV
ncbi:hypothetical protein EDB89DRAFT_2199133 [Lactarius sanguifluus]|nr:hypothetical protein EDB89DRAFT_2199133 [Lactarius sanguifluus]